MDTKRPEESGSGDIHPVWARMVDFQSALTAGMGLHASDDEIERGRRFDELKHDKAFAQSGLQDVVDRFWENVVRTRAHTYLPQSLFNFGRLYQLAYGIVCAPFGRDPRSTPNAYIPGEFCEDGPRGFDEIAGRMSRWVNGTEDIPGVYLGPITSFEVAGFAGRINKETEQQIAGFCGSVVIQWWTIFETFSEDLWEAALNSHPLTLADLGGKTKVSFDDLQRNQFDVKSKMGTVLKERRDLISFRSLQEIQEAYTLAFSEQGKSLADILTAPRLQYAASVRNLLIHKAGIVDAEFIKQTSGVLDVPKVEPGHKFPLTGKLCAQLADSCSYTSIQLLLAVHAWIIGHQ